MGPLELAYFVIILGACGLLGWLAIRCLLQSSPHVVAAGVLLLVIAVVAPLFLAYGWVYGVAAAVIGGMASAVRGIKQAGWIKRLVVVAAVLFMGIEPVGSLWLANGQADERISRCQGDVVIRTLQRGVAPSGPYPVTLHDIAIASEDNGDQNCPLYQGAKVLYLATPTGYTVGYWADWWFVKDVCLQSSGQHGWTCGLNRWGPFQPTQAH